MPDRNGVAVALTDPVGHASQVVLAGLILVCAPLAAMSAAGDWQAHTRLAALDHEPPTATGREAISDLADAIADMARWVRRRVPIAASLARHVPVTWRPAASRAIKPFDPGEHPWRYGCAIGLLAGTSLPLLQVVVLTVSGQLNGPQMSDLAAIAPALIAIETGLAVSGFALLGGYLGLRPNRTRSSDR